MTSNMGTRDLKNNGFGFGNEKTDANYHKMREILLDKVQTLFSPELVNRIDESIVFHALTEQNVYDIIDLQLSDLIQNLAKLGLGLKLSRSAKSLLSKNGYDPKYGVRLLRREIQKSLEDPISELLLKRVFSDGTILSVTVRQKKFHFDIKKTSKVSRRKPKSPAK